ncbi:thermonuclease family protein [bacterium]|nr:thermonuclease family protein [bacterium]
MQRFLIVLMFVGVGCDAGSVTSPQQNADDPARTPIKIDVTIKVMKIIDGDTFFGMNRSRATETVLFRGVDAPEMAQQFGADAREALAKRIEGRTLRLELAENDEFGRTTAEVFDGDESLNVWLIRQGLGWHNWKFDPDEAKAAAEKLAKSERIGLWAADDPMPPWEWKNPPDDGKLYVQGNGSKYHRASCRTLDARRKQISLEDAVQTKQPCKICNPPALSVTNK